MHHLTIILLISVALAGACLADCPLDHFLIGRNPDGIAGTADDNKLFVDCTQKYRHSDPSQSGQATWLNWYYPLYYSQRQNRYYIGEPGFDLIQNTDPARQIQGIANMDYRLVIECVSIKPGFSARTDDGIYILDQAGDTLAYSAYAETHVHVQYRAPAPSGATDLQWITLVIHDQLGLYHSSEPFSVVFVKEPLAGDLVIDGMVDFNDLLEIAYYWLGMEGGRVNDFYERADTNRDGKLDLADFAEIAIRW